MWRVPNGTVLCGCEPHMAHHDVPDVAPRGRRAVSSLLVVAGDGGGCERKRGRGAARWGQALAALRATGCSSDTSARWLEISSLTNKISAKRATFVPNTGREL